MATTVQQALDFLRSQARESGGTLPECLALAATQELVDIWDSYGEDVHGHMDAGSVAGDVEEAIAELQHILNEMRATLQ